MRIPRALVTSTVMLLVLASQSASAVSANTSVMHVAAGTATTSRLCPAGVQSLDAQAAANVSSKVYPGASYMISLHGRLAHTGAVGVSDIDTGSPMREDSIFRLASMSKPITAAAIMILVEEGKLRLDDPLARYLPEFAHLKVGPYSPGADASSLPNASLPITIRQLLTHSSGLEGDPNVQEAIAATWGERTTLAARMPYYASFPLAWEPGTKFGYSGVMGFDALSRVVEIASGQPYDRFLKHRIFRPLGMKDTAFRLSALQTKRLVGIYNAEQGVFTPGVSHFDSDTYFSGAAGLYGTAPDYLRFAEMLAGRGARDHARILSPQSVDLMRSFQLEPSFPGLYPGTGWGLGMRVVAQSPALPPGSYGWSGAFGTHFWVDPEHALAAVFMINLSNAWGAAAPTSREFEQLVAAARASTCPPILH